MRRIIRIVGATDVQECIGDLKLPEVPELALPFVQVDALRLISYYAAVPKGTDVDQQKNLAKSVTVE